MRTLAMLVFIGAAAAVAVYLFRMPTVVDGKVMAADLMHQLKGRGLTRMACDPKIPIGATGAVFECSVGASDGSTARIQYTMDRAGSLKGKVVDGTGPSQPRVPTSSDPWSN